MKFGLFDKSKKLTFWGVQKLARFWTTFFPEFQKWPENRLKQRLNFRTVKNPQKRGPRNDPKNGTPVRRPRPPDFGPQKKPLKWPNFAS